MSRWERWTTKPKEGPSLSTFVAEQQSPAELAAAMGLQSDGSGGYVDGSGNTVARTVNNELVFYDPMGGAISAQSDGAQLTQAQPSWKDPVTGEMTVPPAQPESPEEIKAIPDAIPAQAPAGYNAFMNKKKKDMYADQTTPEQAAVDMTQQEVDPQLGMQPEMAEGMTFAQLRENELEQRMANAYDKRVDQAVNTPNKPKLSLNKPVGTATAPRVQNNINKGTIAAAPGAQADSKITDQDGDGDVDIHDLRKTAIDSWKNWTGTAKTQQRRIEKNLEPAIAALNRPGVDPKVRNRIMHTLMNSYRYQGRDNEASSDLNKAEFHALRDNAQRIKEGYGGAGADGSKYDMNAIREYQKSISENVDEDLLDASFAAMSPQQQKIFAGGDMSARQGYGKYVCQGGSCGYTGLPLDNRTMQMEHFVDHTQARDLASQAKKENREMTPEEQERYDFITGPDNQFWSRQAPNEQKSSRNIQQFYDDRVTPLEELGDDFFDYRELTIDPARLQLKGQEKDMVGHLVEEDEDGGRFLSNMDADGYASHEDAVNQVYEGKKKSLLEGLGQAFDTKKLMGMGPKAFDRAVQKEGSDITEEDRSTYDMLRNLQSKVKGYNPNFSYRLMQALGMPTGFQQSIRSRSTPVSPAFYQTIASQLPGKSKEEQREFLSKVKEWTKGANSYANSQRGPGKKDSDIRSALYQNLLSKGMENGILSPEVLQSNPEMAALVTKYLNQNESLQDLLKVEDEDSFEMGDILKVVKELMMMEKSKAPRKGKDRLKFESFYARIEE